jgi:hypothetical protein
MENRLFGLTRLCDLREYFDGIATAAEELSHYDRVLISR